jgi:excisionase family DNA binding protein
LVDLHPAKSALDWRRERPCGQYGDQLLRIEMSDKPRIAPLATTGNLGLDGLADAIAERILARLHQTEQPRLLSVAEAATYLGRTQKALRLMVANGNVPAVREGSRVHLDRADLDRRLEMRKTQR